MSGRLPGSHATGFPDATAGSRGQDAVQHATRAVWLDTTKELISQHARLPEEKLSSSILNGQLVDLDDARRRRGDGEEDVIA